ncbi:helix-turn-helix domain-containing protein [Metabacillus malikii]|nr:helix-turn-helix domain-containing protein [Metabacillus malikii]
MNDGYLRFIVLLCFQQFKGERSPSAIYHLLKGKKSSQTIQDGKLFNLSFLFGLFPSTTKTIIEAICKGLLADELLSFKEHQHYIVTDRGNEYIERYNKEKPLPGHLDGWKYGDLSRLYWRRYSLLVQVLSNISYKQTSYLPITKNQEDLQWVKKFISGIGERKQKIIDDLYSETYFALKQLTNLEAEIFVKKLTASYRVGDTFEQIAIKQREDPVYIYLMFWNVNHVLIKNIQNTPEHFPMFVKIIEDRMQQNYVTNSTKVTYSFLQKGLDISQIAATRGLKESTIEDHVVELTLHYPNFQPDPFITTEDFLLINDAIDSLQTHRLKQVKEYFQHKYSYFQIRLAYALKGRNR